MYHFGFGFVAAIPSGANPTPIPFGIVQDVSFDFTRDLKKLKGNNRHTVAVGIAGEEITGKIGNASFFGAAIAAITGGTAASGATVGVPQENFTIPGTPWQVTVSQSATFDKDYGVLDNTTGLWMTRGATATGTGVYAVAAGVYTFNTADAGHNVSIAYSYKPASTGKAITVVNQAPGLATGLYMGLWAPPVSSKAFGAELYQVHFTKVGFQLKPEDFSTQSVDFFASQDSTTTTIAKIHTAE